MFGSSKAFLPCQDTTRFSSGLVCKDKSCWMRGSKPLRGLFYTHWYSRYRWHALCSRLPARLRINYFFFNSLFDIFKFNYLNNKKLILENRRRSSNCAALGAFTVCRRFNASLRFCFIADFDAANSNGYSLLTNTTTKG